ncbi:MAG: fasciclin domain-containing protein [Phormidesmis sp.]
MKFLLTARALTASAVVVAAGLLLASPAMADGHIAQETMDETVEDAIEEPTDETTDESEEETMEAPTDEATDETMDEPMVDDPIMDDPTMDESMEEPAGETTDEPVDETMEAPTDEAIEAPADETMEAPVDETIEEPVDETMEAPVDETVGEDTSASTIVDIASGSDSFDTLAQAVEAADLASTLSEPGPYTVFAPTDEAFAELPDGAIEFLLEPENQEILSQVLTYHVVSGETTSDELTTGGISALGGGLAVGVSESGVVINNASVTQADIPASNGVIHQVNRVLIPEALKQELTSLLGVEQLYE